MNNEPLEPPSKALLRALNRYDEYGERAGSFILAAFEQLTNPGIQSPHIVGYTIREALESLLLLDGKKKPRLPIVAKEVVSAWKLSESHTETQFTKAITRLEEVIEGPDPNVFRLEKLITRFARRKLTRTDGDLLHQFKKTLDQANSILHDTKGSVNPETARQLYVKTIYIVETLFGSMVERLGGMDELIAITKPEDVDVKRLRALTGDERHILYFFEQIEGPGWFRVLRDEQLLQPAADPFWAASEYLSRLSKSHPDEIREWLISRDHKSLDADQAYHLIRLARSVRLGVSNAVRKIARPHLDVIDIRDEVVAYIKLIPEDECSNTELRKLTEELFQKLLAQNADSDSEYLSTELVQAVLRLMEHGDALKWLNVLAHRLGDLANHTEKISLRILLPLEELKVDFGISLLALMAGAVRNAMNTAAIASVPLDNRLKKLEVVPQPLADRLLAQHLRDQLPATADQARDFIVDRLDTKADPMPETLSLLQTLLEASPEGFHQDLADALGPPIDPKTIDPEIPLPDRLLHAHRWLVALPNEIAEPWDEINENIIERSGGAAPKDGVLMRTGGAYSYFVKRPRPLMPEFKDWPPLKVAAEIAAWRGNPSQMDGPNAQNVAKTLGEAIEENIESWIETPTQDIVRELQHPIYISTYFQTLIKHSDQLGEVSSELIDAISLVQSEPWPIQDLGESLYGFENTWLNANKTGIQLLREIFKTGSLTENSLDRAWTVVLKAARAVTRDQDLLVSDDIVLNAINRPSMEALKVAFLLGSQSKVQADHRLLELLKESLCLTGTDGHHFRVILSVVLPRLRQVAPDWFTEQRELIFGEEASDGLGVETFDLYLKQGEPCHVLLEEEHSRYLSALDRVPEQARVHLLHGLLWSVDGYEPKGIADVLLKHGEKQLSDAGHLLGWVLFNNNEVNLEPAIALWEELLSRDLSEAYRGWGWLAKNERISEDRILKLLLRTARKTTGNLDQADWIAERAKKSPNNPDALELVALLLAGDPPLWTLNQIGKSGLQLLVESQDSTNQRIELREKLLERGFNKAKNIQL